MFKKIFDWYMEQKMSYILLSIYLMAATSAIILIPGHEGFVVWAWGIGATLTVGPWMWSLNRVTKETTGKSLWGHG